jgi:hypothetical protein
MSGEKSRLEIMAALDLKDEKHFRKRYQQSALAAGLLEMTRPETPQSRLQIYRLTAKGAAVRASWGQSPEEPR